MEPKYPLPPIRILFLECNGVQHYKVTLDKHAEIKWDGIHGVAEQGRRLWDIPPAKLELARQTLEKYDFLNLDKPRDTIDGGLCCISPDFGTFTITAIFMDGSRKTIVHHLSHDDMPKKLFQLERRLETILCVRKWAGPPCLIE